MSTDETSALSTLSPGQKGRVAAIDLPGEQKQRLLEMGLTVGTEFVVVRYAPLGDPLEIKVRGYHLSLRKSDAKGVLVVRL
jgi:Fe2+ transport system protein FeoA